MRNFLLILTFINCIYMNAQHTTDPQLTVTALFTATDQQDWEQVKRCFADEVLLDYSSMSGDPAAALSPEEIVGAWKTILPGFDHTHHQLGNFRVAEEAETAHVFCYGTAGHYLEDEGGNIWTVVGTYDLDLIKEADAWQIVKMRFNFKYQDGNTDLPAKAIELVKK